MRRTMRQRAETFGFETAQPWAADALRLLFCAPRVYGPLVTAWERRFPGTRAALDRLCAAGFAAHQGPVIVDTRTGELADTESRRVDRFALTAAGRRLLDAAEEDLRVLTDTFPRLTEANAPGVAHLLAAFDLDGSDARIGMSMGHAVVRAPLAPRTGRWWVQQFLDRRLLRRLPVQVADVRAVVPEHWRPTRALCRQLGDVLDDLEGAPRHLAVEFRLGRSKFLDDIDPARLGIAGATDYDHDVVAQQVLATLLGSPRSRPEGIFVVEPRMRLALAHGTSPQAFDPVGEGWCMYQPDAELREELDGGRIARSVVEYERHQSRRDAWSHLERFLGYLHLRALPTEAAVLRFVVDTDARSRSYVSLIEAFADYLGDHPACSVPNEVTLMVTSLPRLGVGGDPLDPKAWYRISLPRSGADAGGGPLLHDGPQTPYDEYFARR